jgi:hypothetical protein
MLRRTIPNWELPFPPMPYPGQYTERTRWLWLVPLATGFLSVVGWVLSHDPGPGLALSNRGWLTIVGAAAVVLLLAVHRNDGWRRLLRAIAEYTVVAALAVLLATTATGPGRATPHGRAQATGACPSALQTRAWLTCLWHQANQQPSTTTAPGNSP